MNECTFGMLEANQYLCNSFIFMNERSVLPCPWQSKAHCGNFSIKVCFLYEQIDLIRVQEMTIYKNTIVGQITH